MVPAAPTTGLRAEFLEEIAYYEQRYMRLAEAMPAEKYTWRPAEGVRSVGEVFTHITAPNYGIARHWGPSRRQASISRPSRASLVTNLKSFRL
jgi:DinB family protein